MCSAVENIKEKVLNVEEYHNLPKELGEWREIMKPHPDTSRGQSVHYNRIGYNMVEDVTDSYFFHLLSTILFFPRPFEVFGAFEFLVYFRSEITRWITAENEKLS